MPTASVRAAHQPDTGRLHIRRGMMYMLLAAVLYYFVAGYSGLTLPFEMPAIAADTLLPLLFLAGLGLLLYGFFLRLRG